MEFVKTRIGTVFGVSLGATTIALLCGFIAGIGGIFVIIPSIGVLATSGACFVLKSMGKWETLPGPMPFLFLMVSAGTAVALLIAGILASVTALGSPTVGAAAFFLFAAVAGFSVLTFFALREWRESGANTGMKSTAEPQEMQQPA